jgi:hypothetical protein
MMKRSKLVMFGVMAVMGIGLIGFLTTQVIPKTLVLMTKAAPSQRVSFEKSLILGEIVLASADGIDRAKVNVFVMDATGKGIPGREVTLVGDIDGLPMTATTNDDGMVKFSFSSKKEGVFEVTANVEGVDLGKKMRVTFRN